MKYTLTYAHFDPVSGESKVKIGTRFGNFEATVFVHPDEENVSSFFGCSLAECKALRFAEMAAARQYRAELKALEDYHNLLKNTWSYDENDFHIRQLKRMISEKKADLNVAKHNANALRVAYHSNIVDRDATMAKLYKDKKETK